MPDKRKHRGRHPDDDRLFADPLLETLRTAVAEYSWLLTRGYAVDSALKLVGDRHGLTARQRMAVRRSACTDHALRRRANAMITLGEVGGRSVGIDGYNLLITVESGLSGGLILIGRDGCYRDLASIHGTYRKVEETVPALCGNGQEEVGEVCDDGNTADADCCSADCQSGVSVCASDSATCSSVRTAART